MGECVRRTKSCGQINMISADALKNEIPRIRNERNQLQNNIKNIQDHVSMIEKHIVINFQVLSKEELLYEIKKNIIIYPRRKRT